MAGYYKSNMPFIKLKSQIKKVVKQIEHAIDLKLP